MSAGRLERVEDLSARDRILEAAERLFAERGFDRTSTARIAAAASVPHGLIFYHFKTKMDLLLAVVRDREVLALDSLLLPAAAAADASADLARAVADLWQHLSAALGRPSIVRRIIFQELAAHPEVRQRALELHDQITAIVSRQLAADSSQRAARPAAPRARGGSAAAHHRCRHVPDARRAWAGQP